MPRTPGPLVHGTTSAYTNRKCRCPQCRARMAELQRERRYRLSEDMCADLCGRPVFPGRTRCRHCLGKRAAYARRRREAARGTP